MSLFTLTKTGKQLSLWYDLITDSMLKMRQCCHPIPPFDEMTKYEKLRYNVRFRIESCYNVFYGMLDTLFLMICIPGLLAVFTRFKTYIRCLQMLFDCCDCCVIKQQKKRIGNSNSYSDNENNYSQFLKKYHANIWLCLFKNAFYGLFDILFVYPCFILAFITRCNATINSFKVYQFEKQHFEQSFVLIGVVCVLLVLCVVGFVL